MVRAGRALASAATAALLSLSGCGEPPEQGVWGRKPARLLLVTLDTTRADRIGAYGHAGAHTPNLDNLARTGVRFARAYAPTPVTLPSHTSILTGVYPSAHGVRDNAVFALSDAGESIAEVLGERGWRTGAFVGSFVLDARYGLAQGFEVYHGVSRDAASALQLPERPAEAVVDDALAWFGTLDTSDSFFAWVHFYDPHDPYEPPPAWRERTADLYDGEIAYSDAQLGRLLRELHQRGFGDGLVTIVTADHGESLGEHGEQTHGIFLYDAAVRVPLVVSGQPLAALAGESVDGPVSIAQVAPTILTLAGIGREALPEVKVASLVDGSAQLARPSPAPTIHFETLLPLRKYGWHPLRAIVTNDQKLILGRSEELYSLKEDREELNDLAAGSKDVAEKLRAELAAAFQAHPPLGWHAHEAPGAKALEQLHALGYAGGKTPEAEREDLPDARERIGDLAEYARVHAAIRQSRRVMSQPNSLFADQVRAKQQLEQCRTLLRKLHDGNPLSPLTTNLLGTVECALQNDAAAIPLLEQAVRTSPQDASVRFNLAMCYHRMQKVEDALREMLAVANIATAHAPAYEWLAGFYTSTKEPGHAAWCARRYCELLPEGDPRRRRYAGSIVRLEREARRLGKKIAAPPALAAAVSSRAATGR